MTNNLDLLSVKKYIESLDREKDEKKISELLSVICHKSNVYDIETQCSYALSRVSEGDQMLLKELVAKGYNNVLYREKTGTEYVEYNYYETGFSEEQLSSMVEISSLYQDADGYTVVTAVELDLKAAKKFVKRLFVPQVHCNRCGGHVLKSLQKDYTYQCLNCDEDLFEFETHVVEEDTKELTDEVLNELAIDAYNSDCVPSGEDE